MEEYDEILVRQPVRTKDKIKPHSHYNDRDPDNKLKYGNSRDAGDAPLDVQRQVINALVAEGKRAGLTDHEIALVISIVRFEGNPRYFKMFNPGVRTSVDRLADALLYAGYSEDPLYGRRITTVANSPLMKRALWQYEKWPPEAAEQE